MKNNKGLPASHAKLTNYYKMKKGLKTLITFISFFSLFICSTNLAFAAYDHDLLIKGSDIRFSTDNFLEGRSIRIYAAITNSSSSFDLLGTVRFYDNGDQINGDQPISVLKTKTDDVFVDWNPPWGSHKISIKLIPWEKDGDDPGNNTVEETIYIQQDTDHDGNPNNIDTDDDNDGTPDEKDFAPLDPKEWADTDGDGIGDNADPDDDNDGVPDKDDALPLDPTENKDTDHDGIGDNRDPDDDNDRLSDSEEMKLGTDPLKEDTDNDGVNDSEDPFPLNPAEWTDTDKDNIGNNADIDDDNDGNLDTTDPFPLNKPPVIELSGDIETAAINEDAKFDASNSVDLDGEIVSYKWVADEKYTQEGPTVSYKFATLGDHKVKLTIKDNNGEEKTRDFVVSVFNIRLYSQIFTLLIVLILAGIIVYKYIAEEKLSNLKKVVARKPKK